MNKIELLVKSAPTGNALTWAYPHGDPRQKIYLIPTYNLIVSGLDRTGKKIKKEFECFRFGVWKKSVSASPAVVGLADQQTHIIKSWIPSYEVHSAGSPENGAWQVYGNFLIHDGPDKPMSKRSIYASIGCLAICGGPAGFTLFNDFIIEDSGSQLSSRKDNLAAIGRSRQMIITYEKAIRPKLNPYTK